MAQACHHHGNGWVHSARAVFQEWEESDADVVRAMQAAMIASQATDSKSLLKTRAAAGSIDGRVGSNSPSPNSRCADASACCDEHTFCTQCTFAACQFAI